MTTPAPPLTEAELLEIDKRSEYASGTIVYVAVRDYVALMAAARAALTLESELAQLRREKAEREGLEPRLERWLRSGERHRWIGFARNDISREYRVTLYETASGECEGFGPTYEAALAAALDKLETPNA